MKFVIVSLLITIAAISLIVEADKTQSKVSGLDMLLIIFQSSKKCVISVKICFIVIRIVSAHRINVAYILWRSPVDSLVYN